MKRIPPTLPALLLALVLAACSSAALQPGATRSLQCPPAPALALDAGALLHYHSCLASLAPAALAAEYQAVSQQVPRTERASDRIKLALLLARADTPFRNLPAALRLLNGAADERSLRDLAQLLSATLAQQQRLDERAHALEKELAAEKLHADSLQEKIESVKDLERNMTQREMP